MSKKKLQEFMGFEVDNSQKTKQYHQKVKLLDGAISHDNLPKIGRTDKEVKDEDVNNSYEFVGNQQLVKTTENHVDDIGIQINDKLSVGAAVPRSKKQRSVLIKKEENPFPNYLKFSSGQEPSQSSEDSREPVEQKVRDFRNVVKNIFRLFKIWTKVHVAENKQLLSSLAYVLKSNRKFNNNLILKISKHAELRKFFLTFSAHEGIEQIRQSRIKDKDSHIQALKKYRDICLEKAYEEQQEIKQEPRQNDLIYLSTTQNGETARRSTNNISRRLDDHEQDEE